jgi:hypothetical protein
MTSWGIEPQTFRSLLQTPLSVEPEPVELLSLFWLQVVHALEVASMEQCAGAVVWRGFKLMAPRVPPDTLDLMVTIQQCQGLQCQIPVCESMVRSSTTNCISNTNTRFKMHVDISMEHLNQNDL